MKKKIFLFILLVIFGISIKNSVAQTMLPYRIYIGQTYEEVISLSGCDYMEGSMEQGTTSTVNVSVECLAIPGTDMYEHAFFGVTSFDLSGIESRPNTWWILSGNIYGRCEDGISYTLARIDGEDLSSLAAFFGQNTIEGDAPLKRNFDLNKDGRIDGKDIIDLGVRFGNDMY